MSGAEHTGAEHTGAEHTGATGAERIGGMQGMARSEAVAMALGH